MLKLNVGILRNMLVQWHTGGDIQVAKTPHGDKQVIQGNA